MSRVIDAICTVPWAIREESLEAILSIANRENELDPQAVQALLGRPLENTHTATTRDRVATIPIEGPIVRYANLFTNISGGTSIETIAKDFYAAVNDPSIDSIILSIDSPGGEVNGTAELADLIYESRDVKPIVAYISDMGGSAAYWIASAAERIVVAQTALVGSIGIVATYRREDSADKKARIEFVSSQSPDKRLGVDSEEGRTKIQAMVDVLGSIFVNSVARNRGVSAETVLSDFGAGGVLIGQMAVDAGLADEVGSYEKVHRYLVNHHGSKGDMPENRKSRTNWERFMAFMGADAEDTEPVPEEEPVPVTAIQAATNKDELASLRAENQRLRLERFMTEAKAFVDSHITAQRVFPSEREHVIAAYIQAAMDDLTLGTLDSGTTRVALFSKLYETRPAHQLTMEQLTPALAQVLQRQGTPPAAEAGDKPLTAAQVEELMSKTPLGASLLRDQRNGRG